MKSLSHIIQNLKPSRGKQINKPFNINKIEKICNYKHIVIKQIYHFLQKKLKNIALNELGFKYNEMNEILWIGNIEYKQNQLITLNQLSIEELFYINKNPNNHIYIQEIIKINRI